MITQERLRKLLRYDPDTGWFICLVGRAPLNVGDIAGHVNPSGYRYISIDRTSVLAHRLAWFYMTDSWPEDEIDHKNGMRDDNRFDNLRPVSHRQNQQNQRRPQRNNKLGFLGVVARGKSYRSIIRIDGKHTWLGTFPTPELAHAAYVEAKRKHHPTCTI